MRIPNTLFVQKESDGACSEESDCTNTEFVHYLDQKETNSGAEIASNFKCSTIPFASVSISAEEATGITIAVACCVFACQFLII